MKKLLFLKICKAKYLLSFLFVFVLLFTINNCKAYTYEEFTEFLNGSYNLEQSFLYANKSDEIIKFEFTEQDIYDLYYNRGDLSSVAQTGTFYNMVIYTDNILNNDNNGDYYEYKIALSDIDLETITCRKNFFVKGSSTTNYYVATIKRYNSGLSEYSNEKTFYQSIATFDDWTYLSNMTYSAYIYSNKDIYYRSQDSSLEGKTILYKSEKTVIPDLNLSLEYNDIYSLATITADYDNTQYKLYYTEHELRGNDTGSSGIIHGGGGAYFGDDYLLEYSEPLKVAFNTTYYFYMFDLSDNLIKTESVTINKINSIENLNFSVNFDYSIPGEIYFNPNLPLKHNFNIDIVFDYKIVGGSNAKFIGTNFLSYDDKYINKKVLVNNSQYGFQFLPSSTSLISPFLDNYTDVELSFELYNKTTGVLIENRVYTVRLNKLGLSTLINSSTNGLLDLNSSLNFNDTNFMINTLKGFFEDSYAVLDCITYFFSCIPDWVKAPIMLAITLMVIIAVVKAVRG